MRFLLFPFALLLFTGCSDNRVTDRRPDSAGAVDTTASFLHFASATKWENDWSKENIVVFHWGNSEPDNLHPTNGNNQLRQVVFAYTQRFLVKIDMEKLELRPDLVKSMPSVSDDGLRYTYELRDEPAWDNGAPLTVEDVEFSLKANKCPQTNNPVMKGYIEGLVDFVKDPVHSRKFTLVMREKYIQNVGFLTGVALLQRTYFDPVNTLGHYTLAQFSDPSFIQTPHPDLEKWAAEFNDAKYGRDVEYLPGLGAYQVTAWEPKQRFELTKKKNHWTAKVKNPDMYDTAYPEKIIFKVIIDDNAVALELKKQDIDASNTIGMETFKELQRNADFNRNYHSGIVPNYTYYYIGLNEKQQSVNRTPFFNDRRVRKAVALLTPVDRINADYFMGKATRLASDVLPVKSKVYNKSLALLPFSVDSAKKLLDEAGWKDTDGDNIRDKMIDGKKTPLRIEFLLSSNPFAVKVGKDVADALYLAGIKCDLLPVDFSVVIERATQHQFDMYLATWGGGPGIDDPKQIWHSGAWANGGSNYVGFGTPESDALIDSIRTTLDDALRIPMEKRLQQIIYDDQPYVFLFQVPRKIAIHKRFIHSDMYFEKPGLYLSNLQLMSF